MRVPSYSFSCRALYRPGDAPLPEAQADAFPANELLLGQAAEADVGVPLEYAVGAVRLFNAAGAADEAVAAAVPPLCTDAFFVRSALHWQAGVPGSQQDAARVLRPLGALGEGRGGEAQGACEWAMGEVDRGVRQVSAVSLTAALSLPYSSFPSVRA